MFRNQAPDGKQVLAHPVAANLDVPKAGWVDSRNVVVARYPRANLAATDLADLELDPIDSHVNHIDQASQNWSLWLQAVKFLALGESFCQFLTKKAETDCSVR